MIYQSKPIELLCEVILILLGWHVGSMPGSAFTQAIELDLHHLVVFLAFHTTHSSHLFTLFLLLPTTDPHAFVFFHCLDGLYICWSRCLVAWLLWIWL